jgi:hypothetical protein
MLGRACGAVASYLGLGNCCGSCGVNVSFLVPCTRLKSGLIHNYTICHIVKLDVSFLVHVQVSPGTGRCPVSLLSSSIRVVGDLGVQSSVGSPNDSSRPERLSIVDRIELWRN